MGTGFFIHHRRVSEVKRVDFISDRLSYIVLRGRCCNNIVLNVHALSGEKSDDSKDNFYEELEQVMQIWGERIFSNRQLGISVYIRLILVMLLE